MEREVASSRERHEDLGDQGRGQQALNVNSDVIAMRIICCLTRGRIETHEVAKEKEKQLM